jgi:hypothetical protein
VVDMMHLLVMLVLLMLHQPLMTLW